MKKLIVAVVIGWTVVALSTTGLFVIGVERSWRDYRACGGGNVLVGVTQPGRDCVVARRASRWGPFDALGSTLRIAREE